jgi:hypothetical protein
MIRNTQFSSFEAMLEASGFSVETQEDFEEIPDAPWDDFVHNHTRFLDWESMLDKAFEEWIEEQLEL